MRSSFLALISLAVSVFSQSSTVDDFLARESPIARTGLLANIGPNGSKSWGAKPGIVIASPSRVDPDYVYTWTRDASLVYKAIVDQYVRGDEPTWRSTIDDFVSSQTLLQQVSNPSGSFTSGGLGEPKFHIDLSPYTGGWGRPQRDGPALRATTFIGYANWLIANGNTSYVTSKVWPVIKPDLDYVASTWNQTGFDLWEEVSSSSYFTTAVQHRALREGAALASKIGQTSVVSNYLAQADNTLCFMQSYWNPSGGYMTANTGGGRSSRDANTALASVHTFDIEAGCDPVTFQPCSDKALSSLKVYIDSFRSIYAINAGIPSNAPVATGRYPEDVYYGGNPWYLTTLVVSEQLYHALHTWEKQGYLEVTDISLAFFRSLVPAAATGTFNATSETYTQLTGAVKTYADGFISVVQKYTPADGSLAEQYTRGGGVPISAKDLTWSYASILTTVDARNNKAPPSWGAKGLTVPAVCSRSGGGGGGGGGAGYIPVTFKVVANTVWGENIFVTGSVNELANWSPDLALALLPDNYPTWSVTINIPANTNFEYKFIRKNNGAVTWESDPNRQLTTPASGEYTVNANWRSNFGWSGVWVT